MSESGDDTITTTTTRTIIGNNTTTGDNSNSKPVPPDICRMNIDKYLERINCSNLRDNTLQSLSKLQRNHLINVPFENLDIHLGKKIDCFDLEKIYEKVIVKKRGGFCFELNSLFAWLLGQLAFKYDFIGCSVYSMQTRDWSPWLSHMALLVHLNSETSYLTDVGFTRNFRTPLKLKPDQIQTDATGFYKIVKNADATDDSFIVLRCIKQIFNPVNPADALLVNGVVNPTVDSVDWKPLYKFKRMPRKLDDFLEIATFVQTIEYPRFFYNSITAIHTTYSVLTLRGFDLCETSFFDSVQKTSTHSQLTRSEVFEALKNIYGIYIDAEFEPRQSDLF